MGQTQLSEMLSLMLKKGFHQFITSAARGLLVLSGPSRETTRNDLIESNPSESLAKLIEESSIDSLVIQGRLGTFEGPASDTAITQKLALSGEWSPKLIESIIAFFGRNRSGTYLDIGANIGLTCIPIAARSINTVAVEANPKNFIFLERNRTRNDVTEHLELHNLALSNRSGHTTLELSPNNHGDNRLQTEPSQSLIGEDTWETLTVNASTLDELLPNLQQPIFIKMDVQGAEPLVLEGGQKTFGQASKIHFEFSPYNMERMRTRPEPLIQLLDSFPIASAFECEENLAIRSGTGSELGSFLVNYYAKHKSTPYGKYLNIVAERDIT